MASLRALLAGALLALLSPIPLIVKKMNISIPGTAAILLPLATGAVAGALWSGVSPERLEARQIPDHAAFDEVLEQVVEQPLVDYEALSRNPSNLDAYVAALGRTDPGVLSRASREERLAFWINAYNACMLKLVAEHYPLRRGDAGFIGSIRNFFAGYPANSVWSIRNVFGREHCDVAGEPRSQDEIEHEIIRPTFQDPRIHFAVNCAARSCPALWPEAYHAGELDAQLDRAVTHFIETPAHFRFDPGPPAMLELNKVMEWYQSDFGGIEGLKEFFAGYLSGDRRERMLRPETDVRFFEYDWTLNDAGS